MPKGKYSCNHCGRSNFKTENGLKQHQLTSQFCQAVARKAVANHHENVAPTRDKIKSVGQQIPWKMGNIVSKVGTMFLLQNKDVGQDLVDFGMQQDDNDAIIEEDPVLMAASNQDPIDQPLVQFRKYITDVHKQQTGFSTIEANSLKLLHVL